MISYPSLTHPRIHQVIINGQQLVNGVPTDKECRVVVIFPLQGGDYLRLVLEAVGTSLQVSQDLLGAVGRLLPNNIHYNTYHQGNLFQPFVYLHNVICPRGGTMLSVRQVISRLFGSGGGSRINLILPQFEVLQTYLN